MKAGIGSGPFIILKAVSNRINISQPASQIIPALVRLFIEPQ
jgi:hypothetical protein